MRRRTFGVTLIELMVVSTVTIIVSAGLFTLLYRSWMNHDVLLTQNQVQRQARTALDMVCDELRNIYPWISDNVVLAHNDYGSAIGQAFPTTNSAYGFTLALNGSHQLVLFTFPDGPAMYSLGNVKGTVSNITEFTMAYEVRSRTADGSMNWSTVQDLHSDSNGFFIQGGDDDSRVASITAAQVTVTASRLAANGQTYSCRMTSTVKLRNQLFPIVAPAGS